jgi:hypothetical protein
MSVSARGLRVLGLVGVVLVVGLLGLCGSAFAGGSASGLGLAASPAVVPLLVPTEPPAEPTTGPTGVLTGSTAVLEGTLNAGAGGTSGYYFAYNVGESCEGGPTTAPGEASGGVVDVEVGELEPAERYTFCLVATNGFGSTSGAGVSFETKSVPPTVESVSFSGVTDRAAVLAAQIDPHGTQTSYQFEYSSDGSHWVKAPEPAGLVSGREGTGVSVRVGGLAASTAYRFRVTATNAHSEAGLGMEGSFSTLSSGISGLPDGRVYEMVTPSDNENADVYIPLALSNTGNTGNNFNGVGTAFPFAVAADGEAVVYVGDATADEGGNGRGGAGLGNQYLARRSPDGGWRQASIQPPGYEGGTFYQAFSSDLSAGVLNSALEGGLPPLSSEVPAGGHEVLYERDLGGSAYRPLFNAVPPDRPNASFGAQAITDAKHFATTPIFAGASADFGQLLFEANDALIVGEGALERELKEDVKQEIGEGEKSDYLYDSAGGRLSLVDVLPDGKVQPDATFGASAEGNLEWNPPDFDHVISGDGRRIYWTALGTGVVYVREDGTSTVPVSAGAARFWTATGDGRYAFYTENGELLRFDIEHPAAPEVLAGAGAGVEGVIGAGESGEDVYFVASAQLAPGAEAGQPNLYLVRTGRVPAVTFIATLNPSDGNHAGLYGELEYYSDPGEGEIGDWHAGLGQRTAEVTPDGGSVVFMSSKGLKVPGFPGGYPAGPAEVYVYDAGAGKLLCASCDPSGEAGGEGFLPGGEGFLPISWSDTYIPRWISEDGSRVFFNSTAPLVAQDTNGAQDVYEWEREGSGSCREGTGTDGGCAYLLSGGVSKSASWLAGASANGGDVFIITRAQLTPEDQDEAYNLFDARVGGVPLAVAVGCVGGACPAAPPAAPPGFAAPPSVTSSGGGNFPPSLVKPAVKPRAKRLTRAQKLAAALKTCRRARGRARVACEVRARRRYGPVGRAKRTSASAKKGRR